MKKILLIISAIFSIIFAVLSWTIIFKGIIIDINYRILGTFGALLFIYFIFDMVYIRCYRTYVFNKPCYKLLINEKEKIDKKIKENLKKLNFELFTEKQDIQIYKKTRKNWSNVYICLWYNNLEFEKIKTLTRKIAEKDEENYKNVFKSRKEIFIACCLNDKGSLKKGYYYLSRYGNLSRLEFILHENEVYLETNCVNYDFHARYYIMKTFNGIIKFIKK